MPVIQIHALTPSEAERVDMCLSAAIEAVSEALRCPPSAVWAQFVPVAAMHTGQRPRRYIGHCPVVIVRAMPGRSNTQVRAAMTGLAAGISAALDLPLDDIWVQWQTLEPGRVFSGGAMRDATA